MQQTKPGDRLCEAELAGSRCRRAFRFTEVANVGLAKSEAGNRRQRADPVGVSHDELQFLQSFDRNSCRLPLGAGFTGRIRQYRPYRLLASRKKAMTSWSE